MANFIFITKYLNAVFLARLMDRQIYLYYGMLRGIVNNCDPLFIKNSKASFIILRRLSISY